MLSKVIDTAHSDAIHDVKIDPSGALLASSSSDCTVRITDAGGNRILDVLHGHNGPVWSVSWAPQIHGVMLASASYCGKVVVWTSKTAANLKFEPSFEYQHGSSVNCVAWAPAEAGHPELAAGCSDGVVVVLRQKVEPGTVSGSFEPEKIVGAHGVACAAVSWSPRGTELVSGGFDNLVKIWARRDGDGGGWKESAVLAGHSGWVRDVQWNPIRTDLIASCSDDETVRIWESSQGSGSGWVATKVLNFSAKGTPWHVSWSLCGTLLAVSCGEGSISLWRRGTEGGDWTEVPRKGVDGHGEGVNDSVAQL